MKHDRKKNKKKTKHKKSHPIAFAWYTREQWELLCQVASDADSMDETFEQWEETAGNAYRMLLQSGYPVRTVNIDVAELLRWCKARNRPVDGEARTDFVMEKLEDRI
ncbi:MAG: hypothetical protein ACLFUN_04800 [Desulfobacterales bacterium]